MKKLSKNEIAEEVYNILKSIDCDNCPLRAACDLVDDETNQGTICSILENEKVEDEVNE